MQSPPSPRQRRRTAHWLMLLALLSVLVQQRPVRAAATTIYVVPGGAGDRTGADWANAMDLQPALTGAAAGTEIWVRQGTYTPAPPGDREASFQLKNDVELYGGFAGSETARAQRDPKANPTILSGDLLGNNGEPSASADNAYRVVNSSNNDRSAVLDGFTIRDGIAQPYGWGAGIAVIQGSPTLRNLLIVNNFAMMAGGLLADHSQLTLSHVDIINNATMGGASALLNDSGTITITDSYIGGNNAFENGAISNWGTLLISNSVIHANGAHYCGALDSYGSVTILQSTFAGNGVGEGDVMCLNGPLTVRNSIIWNSANGLEDETDPIDIQHSIVWGGYPGAGNLNVDPEFVDLYGQDNQITTLDTDLHLKPTSPAINIGVNGWRPADLGDRDGDGDTAEPAPFDYDGGPRLIDGTIDLGAYESPATPAPCPTAARLYVRPGAAGAGDGTSWPDAYADLAPGLLVARRCSTVAELWVAGGTYKPSASGDKEQSFELRNGLAIFGGFAGTETALSQRDPAAHPSVLSGDLLGNDSGAVDYSNPARADNSSAVVQAQGVDGSGSLDGFTIVGGRGENQRGGGLRVIGGRPVLRNLAFSGNTAVVGGAIGSAYSRYTLSRATFVGNTAFYGGAISMFSSAPRIGQALFSGNSARNEGGALEAEWYSYLTISDSTFSANSAPDSSAIKGAESSISLENSIVWGNTGDAALDGITARRSIVQGGYAGDGNLDADPLFVDFDGTDNITGTLDDDLRLLPASPALDAGDNTLIPADLADDDGDGDRAEPAPFDVAGRQRVRGAAVDMGAYEFQPLSGNIIYVAPEGAGDRSGVDWENASELQPALTGAISGTQIWAARGIYRPGPGGDRAATFQLKNGVALYGGFAGNELLLDQRDLAANPTILSGDLLANDGAAGANSADNSYHVVTGSGINASALLDGFIVEGGSATPVHCAGAPGCVDDPLASVGGGMLTDHGSPTLRAVTFRANNAEFTGGALYNATSSPILDHVTFTNNRAGAGGAIYNVFSAPLIIGSVFVGNAATDEGAPAGAIFNASSNPIISNSRFEHNIALSSGGAIYNDTSSPVIIGSVFVGNQALGQGSSGGGGGAIDYYSDSAPLIVRSTFTANTAPRGGAIRGQNSAGRILFSTFFGNRALEGDSPQPGGGMGGAISIDYGSLWLSHVLLSGNQAVNGAGGGVMAENAALSLDNMTIVENRAASGGALAMPQSTAWITNSIVWGNTGLALSATAGLSVSHSLVQGGYPGGDAILDADPLFLDFAGLDGTVGTADDDLRLRGDSPAVDAGDTAALPADTIDDDGDGDRAEPAPRDLAGNRRVRGAAVDLGAYEVTSAISNTAPPPGMYGSSYSYQLVADTDKPMAYELVQGTPPIGTTLNSATGLILGTPLWVGTYSFVLRYGPAFRNVSITIAPTPLLITANNLQRAPGTANPALTVTYSGFVLDDDAADLLGAPTCTTTATIASPPGTYPITCTAGSIANPNYALSFAAGTLTVGAYPYRLALPQVTR